MHRNLSTAIVRVPVLVAVVALALSTGTFYRIGSIKFGYFKS